MSSIFWKRMFPRKLLFLIQDKIHARCHKTEPNTSPGTHIGTPIIILTGKIHVALWWNKLWRTLMFILVILETVNFGPSRLYECNEFIIHEYPNHKRNTNSQSRFGSFSSRFTEQISEILNTTFFYVTLKANN